MTEIAETDLEDRLSLSYLLNTIDGTMAPEDVIFVMTTNHIQKLDPALIRPGRMDINVVLNKCDRYQLECVYKDLFKKDLDPKIGRRFRENEFIVADVILHVFHNMFDRDTPPEELLSKYLSDE